VENQHTADLELSLQARIKEVLGNSLHIRHVDAGSCNGCDFEMMALCNPVYDVQRFGIDFVASPRHADMLLVTGGGTRHLEVALEKTYAAAAAPKMVVAIGACACGGGVVGQSYANIGGIDRIVPVVVYVPGCPPRPSAILAGILLALDKLAACRAAGF
jgi:Ni,Fe-hydrogenase III small subunit